MAAMRLGDALANGQPQPGAAHRPAARSLAPVQPLEQAGQGIVRDPRFRILDIDHHGAVRDGHRQMDASARIGVAGGIFQQVAEQLRQAVGVSRCRRESR